MQYKYTFKINIINLYNYLQILIQVNHKASMSLIDLSAPQVKGDEEECHIPFSCF